MIKITCEHNRYSSENCVLFRFDQEFFIIKNYIYLSKTDFPNIYLEHYRIFEPIFIDNVKSIICFSDAIVIIREDKLKNDFYIIEQTVSATMSYLASMYVKIDLIDLEQSMIKKVDKFETHNSGFFLKYRLTKFIEDFVGKTFQAHGGYCIIEHVDESNKIVEISMIGNCRQCKYKIMIVNKIKEFMIESTKQSYKVQLN